MHMHIHANACMYMYMFVHVERESHRRKSRPSYLVIYPTHYHHTTTSHQTTGPTTDHICISSIAHPNMTIGHRVRRRAVARPAAAPPTTATKLVKVYRIKDLTSSVTVRYSNHTSCTTHVPRPRHRHQAPHRERVARPTHHTSTHRHTELVEDRPPHRPQPGNVRHRSHTSIRGPSAAFGHDPVNIL